MRIHDRLTLLSLRDRRDLLFFMCGAGGGVVSRGYCGTCMTRLSDNVGADAFDVLRINSEPRSNRACYNCERPVMYETSTTLLKPF